MLRIIANEKLTANPWEVVMILFSLGFFALIGAIIVFSIVVVISVISDEIDPQ